MRRDIFTSEHDAFRLMVREFIEREVVPHYAGWEQAGEIPREFFGKLGELGVMGMAIPEKYGGAGQDDYRYNVILQEEAARALVTLGTVRTQLDVILPYFRTYAGPEQCERWFPGLAAGELLTAIAMTEPDTGSDLAGVRTTAVADGDHYVLSGAKTFITGGLLADLVVVLGARSRTPASCRSPTCGCPSPTGWGRRGRRSGISATTFRRSGWRSRWARWRWPAPPWTRPSST